MKTGEKRGYYNQTQKGNEIFYIQKKRQTKQCTVSYANQQMISKITYFLHIGNKTLLFDYDNEEIHTYVCQTA